MTCAVPAAHGGWKFGSIAWTVSAYPRIYTMRSGACRRIRGSGWGAVRWRNGGTGIRRRLGARGRWLRERRWMRLWCMCFYFRFTLSTFSFLFLFGRTVVGFLTTQSAFPIPRSTPQRSPFFVSRGHLGLVPGESTPPGWCTGRAFWGWPRVSSHLEQYL